MNKQRVIKAGKYSFPLGKKTYIMGIVNVTPDSFSDGGEFASVEKAVSQAKRLIAEGADIIDVGGESTRPGSEEISAPEELKRVLLVVKALLKEVNVPISVDTYKASVAQAVLKEGVHIINDVWGLSRDKEMAKVIASFQVPVVIMHNQIGTKYSSDIMEEIKRFLTGGINRALQAGVKEEQIIIDPGIGFGKDFQQNLIVISRLEELQELGYPLLLGTSRKSFLGKILDLPPKERVEGTLATTVLGIMKGTDFVRVHDVKENQRGAKVTDAIIRGWENG